MISFYRKPNALRRILTILLPILIVGVLAGSLMPERAKISLGTATQFYIVRIAGHGIVVNPHRTVHVMAFVALTLVAAALANTVRRRVAVALAILLLAVAIEAGEHLIFHNTLEWSDIEDDSEGIAIGLAALQAAVWWKRNRVSGSIR